MFSEQQIDLCTAADFGYVQDDIDYQEMKIYAIYDDKIRNMMITYCFKIAGVDRSFSNSCDSI